MRAEGAAIVLHIEREMKLHLDYCKTFGVSKETMEAADEHLGRRALEHAFFESLRANADSVLSLTRKQLALPTGTILSLLICPV